MKTIAVIFLLGVMLSETAGQIPNPDFEKWDNGNPEGWFTSNFTDLISNITKTSAAYTGNSAVKGEVIRISDNPVPPVLISGSKADGFPLTMQPEWLSLYCQFYPEGGDRLYITVALYNSDFAVGGGSTEVINAIAGFANVTVQIDYISPQQPDRCMITITAGTPGSAHAGTFFIIDDIEFTEVTKLEEDTGPFTFNLQQNYPNPFNPVTRISYTLPEENNVVLTIYNSVGEEVKKIVNEVQSAGNYEVDFNASNLPGGVYFYRLSAGNFVSIKKMILLK